VLFNILSNAVKFTKAGGTITVTIDTDADGLGIVIHDTGVGMSAQTLARVSEPFVQGDSSISREQDGTGLGLSLARADIALHHGRLAIASSPGHGTTVSILLPRSRLVPGGQSSASGGR